MPCTILLPGVASLAQANLKYITVILYYARVRTLLPLDMRLDNTS